MSTHDTPRTLGHYVNLVRININDMDDERSVNFRRELRKLFRFINESMFSGYMGGSMSRIIYQLGNVAESIIPLPLSIDVWDYPEAPIIQAQTEYMLGPDLHVRASTSVEEYKRFREEFESAHRVRRRELRELAQWMATSPVTPSNNWADSAGSAGSVRNTFSRQIWTETGWTGASLCLEYSCFKPICALSRLIGRLVTLNQVAGARLGLLFVRYRFTRLFLAPGPHPQIVIETRDRTLLESQAKTGDKTGHKSGHKKRHKTSDKTLDKTASKKGVMEVGRLAERNLFRLESLAFAMRRKGSSKTGSKINFSAGQVFADYIYLAGSALAHLPLDCYPQQLDNLLEQRMLPPSLFQWGESVDGEGEGKGEHPIGNHSTDVEMGLPSDSHSSDSKDASGSDDPRDYQKTDGDVEMALPSDPPSVINNLTSTSRRENAFFIRFPIWKHLQMRGVQLKWVSPAEFNSFLAVPIDPSVDPSAAA